MGPLPARRLSSAERRRADSSSCTQCCAGDWLECFFSTLTSSGRSTRARLAALGTVLAGDGIEAGSARYPLAADTILRALVPQGGGPQARLPGRLEGGPLLYTRSLYQTHVCVKNDKG